MEKKPVIGDIWKYAIGADDTRQSYWFIYKIKNEVMYMKRIGTQKEFQTEYSFDLMKTAKDNWFFVQGSK